MKEKKYDVLEDNSKRVNVPPDREGCTFVESHTNQEMADMLLSMEPYLNKATGKFGYAIARNTRKIKEACSEYLKTRFDLIRELGEEQKDQDGNPTGIIGIKIGTEGFKVFEQQLSEYAGIKHSVEIYKTSYFSLPDDMTAGEMLTLEWMLVDVSIHEEAAR